MQMASHNFVLKYFNAIFTVFVIILFVKFFPVSKIDITASPQL